MNARISEQVRMDLPILPQALNNGSVTGRGVDLSGFAKALFVAIGAGLAATKVTTLKVRQATDDQGSDIKDITGAEKSVTANTLVLGTSLTLTTVVAGNQVTVNGVVFEAAATADLENYIFAVGGTDAETATNLAAAINHAKGPAGVYAEAAATVVTVHAVDSAVTVTNPTGTIVAATTKHAVYVEIKAADLDRRNGFASAVPVITTDGDTTVAVHSLRGDARFMPEQIVVGLVV